MITTQKTRLEAQPLADDNIVYLRQGLELLADLGDEEYVRTFRPSLASSIGAHLRHIVDHYSCFLGGVASGSIDYDDRARDSRVETDRGAAAEAIRGIIAGLESIGIVDRELAVRIDCGRGPVKAGIESQSTMARELQFLVSHTVHHYALVAIILRMEGREPVAGFGISPSTLRYQDSLR